MSEVHTALRVAVTAEVGARAIDDDTMFFEAGLTSLRLVAVLERVQQAFPELNLVDLYRFPSVRALGDELVRRGTQVPVAGGVASDAPDRPSRQPSGSVPGRRVPRPPPPPWRRG